MRWNDERFVKLYTRDTVGWLALSWDARSVFLALLRKVDRAGILDLGRHGIRGLAVLLGCEAKVAESSVAELVADGCLCLNGAVLAIPNFLEAQETPVNDAQRKRRSREIARSQSVTSGHNVTDADTNVTTRQDKTRQDEVLSPEAPSVFAPMKERLVKAYEETRKTKYPFDDAKDAMAVKRILKLTTNPEEAAQRFVQGLTHSDKFYRIHTIAQLSMSKNWAAYDVPSGAEIAKPPDLSFEQLCRRAARTTFTAPGKRWYVDLAGKLLAPYDGSVPDVG